MKKPIIEICASSFEIARVADIVGADRIEICHDLSVGGLTPSYENIRKCAQLDLATRVLIRPRAGDFCFAEKEKDQMLMDIEKCREYGVEGIVTGALESDGSLDIPTLQDFKKTASDLKLIFHRGIDLCTDKDALNKIVDLGFHGILTSGSSINVDEGMNTIEKHVKRFGDRLEIVAGGGVSSENVKDLLSIGIHEIHFSCQKLATKDPSTLNEGRDDPSHRSHTFDVEKWRHITKEINSILSSNYF